MFDGLGKFWKNYHSQFLEGVGTTIYISIMGILIGFLFGLIIGYLRNVHISRKDNKLTIVIKRSIKYILDGYISFFRFTPFIAQLFFAWFGLFLASGVSRVTIAIVVLALNTAAFHAKVIEGGIGSINEGQYLAGRSLGMSHRRTFISIIMPQAFKNMISGFSNEWVNVIKATSVLTVIGISDLMDKIKKGANSLAEYSGPYFLSLIAYFIICFIFMMVLKGFKHFLERRW